MYIQQNYDNINMRGKNDPQFWKRIKQRVLNAIPEATIKDNTRRLEHWGKIDDGLSHPAKNRLIMGATALITQPTIDFYNHNVDKETREVSRIRTISKIVAGTLVGIIVRGSCYKLVEKMTDIKGSSRLSKALLPNKYLNEIVESAKLHKNYKSALSTSIAILAMCVTNFLIDAPLTIFLTNNLNDRRKEKKVEQANRRNLL